MSGFIRIGRRGAGTNEEVENKEQLRMSIAQDVARFLQAGNHIEQLEVGQTAIAELAQKEFEKAQRRRSKQVRRHMLRRKRTATGY